MKRYIKLYGDLIAEKTTLEPKTLIEIGSRDALDACSLAEYFNIKEKNVYIIEPHPQSYANILKNFPKYKHYNLAFFNENGESDFYALKTDVGISSLYNRKDNFYEKTQYDLVKVKTVTGKTFIEENGLQDIGFDLCKIDVEGLSYEVLRGFQEKISCLKSVHIECEYHEIWKEQKTYEQVKDLLKKNDFVLLHEEGVNETKVQSDSIWVRKDYLV